MKVEGGKGRLTSMAYASGAGAQPGINSIHLDTYDKSILVHFIQSLLNCNSDMGALNEHRLPADVQGCLEGLADNCKHNSHSRANQY
jgi:hypothetical protein